jgi:tetratricopeptide (TPR) repeat protein
MKIDADLPRAVELFAEALTLDPDHQDSRYYLANCLATMDRVPEALAELEELARRNPGSARAHRQRGVLLARRATSDTELAAAREALERAVEINREETGALQTLGEVALLQGDYEEAGRRFEWVSQANSKAVGALFLRSYIDWTRGDQPAARKRLELARRALGEDWKPPGATAEGDVAVRVHRDMGPLAGFWQAWDGEADPGTAFADLDLFLGPFRAGRNAVTPDSVRR